MEQKIDIHRSGVNYRRLLARIRNSDKVVPENKVWILKYLQDAELGKTILMGQKRKIGIRRNLRVALYLLRLDEHFRKAFPQVSIKDMEEFIGMLDKGVIRNKYSGRPLADQTRAHFKKAIKKYWKWLKGDCRAYPPEVDWIDTTFKLPPVKTISGLRSTIEKVRDASTEPMHRALVMTFFDSGARPEEFLNLRVGDVTEGEQKVLFAHIRYSKTFTRQISLPIASTELREWLKRHPYKHRPNAQLFPISNIHILGRIVKALVTKATGASVTPYQFRRTSATYYSQLLDRPTLCKRMGWTYTSDEADRYIDLSQMREVKTIEAVRAAERNKESAYPVPKGLPEETASQELGQKLDEQATANQKLTEQLNQILSLLKAGIAVRE